ncbi:hypothetical protein HMPREF9999_02051 [Alloprevotella sp. oral taxon 473 str. F0040]|jgi:hypothetical protein|nr:hypothetical protein HMPREF9999_02051 [Alloprevotella sp. oral taxon 473 str. F0040]
MVVWVKQMSSFVVLTRVEDSLSKKILEQMGAYCGDTAHKCVFFVMGLSALEREEMELFSIHPISIFSRR